MAAQGLAHIAVTEGDRAEVLPLVDEAAALAMRPGVEPIHAGYVYCAVISICRALCDWGRATEWTTCRLATASASPSPVTAGFVASTRGRSIASTVSWPRRRNGWCGACEELRAVSRFSAVWGYSELVDIRVRRGDLAGAEEALVQAVAFGDDGQPGRGRLLLAQGDVPVAVRSLDRALADRGMLARERRVFVLPVHVRACLAVGDEPAANASVTELEAVRALAGDAGLAAAAAVARGELALYRGDAEAAIGAGRSRASAPGARSTLRTKLRRYGRADLVGADRRRRPRRGPPRDQGRRTNRGGDRRRRQPRHRSDKTRARDAMLRTFLFSDIVDSTRLAEAMGDDTWEQLLRWHDRILRGPSSPDGGARR